MSLQQLLVLVGLQTLWLSKPQSYLEPPGTWIQPLSSYNPSYKILVALSERTRMLAVEFLFGKGLGAAIWLGLGGGLKGVFA